VYSRVVVLVATFGLAVAFSPSSSGQAVDEQKVKDGKQAEARAGDTKAKMIRGRVAGVSLVGETIIDPTTNTAMAARATYLTIIGAPAEEGRESERAAHAGREAAGREAAGREGREHAAMGERGRHNMYVIAITPQTQIHMKGEAEHRAGETATGRQPQAEESSHAQSKEFEKLELGDLVEVAFLDHHIARKPTPEQAKHGRHRLYQGEASEITILSTPEQGQGTSTSPRDENESRTNRQEDRSTTRPDQPKSTTPDQPDRDDR
jgi:hypothetical protein